jgi:hypothetical protein
MVTRAQALRIEARVEELAAGLGTDVTVVVFRGETPEFAMARHRELRPDHAGQRVRLEWRNEERNDIREMFAVCSEAEVRAFFDELAAKDRDFVAEFAEDGEDPVH